MIYDEYDYATADTTDPISDFRPPEAEDESPVMCVAHQLTSCVTGPEAADATQAAIIEILASMRRTPAFEKIPTGYKIHPSRVAWAAQGWRGDVEALPFGWSGFLPPAPMTNATATIMLALLEATQRRHFEPDEVRASSVEVRTRDALKALYADRAGLRALVHQQIAEGHDEPASNGSQAIADGVAESLQTPFNPRRFGVVYPVTRRALEVPKLACVLTSK